MRVPTSVGSTGGLGRVALQTILDEKLVPVSELRISTTNPDSVAAGIVSTGIEIRKGDLYTPSTLVEAFSGADVLFLVSFPSMGEERYALHRNGIDAAKAAGVRHVIYTSLSFSGGKEDSPSVAQVAHAHLKTEAYLKQSGLSYTIIRYGSYSHLWNNYAGFLDLSSDPSIPQEAVLPNDGLGQWVNRDDLGEATGRIIANWVRTPAWLRGQYLAANLGGRKTTSTRR